MRVLHYDDKGNLTCTEAICVTALSGCIAIDTNMAEEIAMYDYVNGISGVHIIPLSDNIADLFIPCSGHEDKVTQACASGILDMSAYEQVYDASKWRLY